MLAGKKLCLVSILRAGNGILDGMLDLVPSARVGHIGLYRDPSTLQAVEYYLKLPDDMPERDVILVDPMLATGNSAVAAISRLVELRRALDQVRLPGRRARRRREGARRFPDVPIFTAAIDRGSTTTATSCPASATPATGCSAPNSAALPHQCLSARGRSQGARRSRAIATNLTRCSGDRIERRSSV